MGILPNCLKIDSEVIWQAVSLDASQVRIRRTQGHLKWISSMVDADEYGTDRRQDAERRSTDHRDVKARHQESAVIGKYGAHECGCNQSTKP